MQYPVDLEQYDRREQLKKSGLGKVSFLFLPFWSSATSTTASRENSNNYFFFLQVIMFLSKSDEETTSNRKLAKDLVDKWVIILLLWSFVSAIFHSCLLRAKREYYHTLSSGTSNSILGKVLSLYWITFFSFFFFFFGGGGVVCSETVVAALIFSFLDTDDWL